MRISGGGQPSLSSPSGFGANEESPLKVKITLRNLLINIQKFLRIDNFQKTIKFSPTPSRHSEQSVCGFNKDQREVRRISYRKRFCALCKDILGWCKPFAQNDVKGLAECTSYGAVSVDNRKGALTLVNGTSYGAVSVDNRKGALTLVNGTSYGAVSADNRKSAIALVNGTSYGALSADNRKCAFTLAEVLITLGIIGIVAAMTLPTVVGKYREKTTMAKLKKFYTTMAQAQLRSINDNGEVDCWEWVPSGGESNNQIIMNWFNKYWGQYLNKFEVIDKKNLNDNDELVDAGIVIKFADGTVAKFGSFSGGYMHIVFYTNYKTFIEGKATEGKDSFLFGFNTTTSKRFNTYGSTQKDENQLKNNLNYGCYNPSARNGNAYCARLLQFHDWSAPDDYPYKF